MLHHFAHYLQTFGDCAATAVAGICLAEAVNALRKKQPLRTVAVLLLAALLWSNGIGTRPLCWLAFLGVFAVLIGIDHSSNRRKVQADLTASPPRPQK